MFLVDFLVGNKYPMVWISDFGSLGSFSAVLIFLGNFLSYSLCHTC